MMISRADFEELFPELFQPEPEFEPTLAAPAKTKGASAECIARWEDDGGRSLSADPKRRAVSDRSYQFGYGMPAFARAAAMPAVAAYEATWAVLSGHGQMTKGQQSRQAQLR